MTRTASHWPIDSIRRYLLLIVVCLRLQRGSGSSLTSRPMRLLETKVVRLEKTQSVPRPVKTTPPPLELTSGQPWSILAQLASTLPQLHASPARLFPIFGEMCVGRGQRWAVSAQSRSTSRRLCRTCRRLCAGRAQVRGILAQSQATLRRLSDTLFELGAIQIQPRVIRLRSSCSQL